MSASTVPSVVAPNLELCGDANPTDPPGKKLPSTVTFAEVTIPPSKPGEPPTKLGLFFLGTVVQLTTPLLKFMMGWDGHRVKAYADGRGWTVRRVVTKPLSRPGDPLPPRPAWAPTR